ncbi:MAG: response regulator transcription factor [Asticcacaulis sp.]|nr:response regulator transcription factor [Asticcacaulis sp.]
MNQVTFHRNDDMARPQVLLADASRDPRQSIETLLLGEGFDVHCAGLTRDVDRILAKRDIDVILLDSLPDEDGLSLCRRLSRIDAPPIMMVTTRADDIDRIVGLELGADDYIAKPFHPRELLARIRAIVRRVYRAGRHSGHRSTCFADWRLDNIKRQLTRPDGKVTVLSNVEFDLLRLLLAHPRQVMTREDILDGLHGRRGDTFDIRCIDVQMVRLRKKLATGSKQEIIRTIRGVGYMFELQPAAPF